MQRFHARLTEAAANIAFFNLCASAEANPTRLSLYDGAGWWGGGGAGGGGEVRKGGEGKVGVLEAKRCRESREKRKEEDENLHYAVVSGKCSCRCRKRRKHGFIRILDKPGKTTNNR